MRQIRKLLCILLVLCALLPVLPAARAEEIPEDERFAGKTWDEIIQEFLQSWGTDPRDVGIGYYNTVTGEEHYVNPDQYMVSASMYKVPLNMVYADRVSKGEMDWDTNVCGYPYEVVLEQTIVYSNNDIACDMVRYDLGNGNWQEGRRALSPYCGLDPETVDWKFLENNYSTPRQVIDCLRLLYENPDRFPRIIETMQRAEPNEYFKRREQRFNIAHKYGFLTDNYRLYMNDCGIAFTDDPILLVLFTDNVTHAYDVMTEFCTLMCDYAQYRHALRVAAEARAEAEAEQRRLEEENQAAPGPEETQEPPAVPTEPPAPVSTGSEEPGPESSSPPETAPVPTPQLPTGESPSPIAPQNEKEEERKSLSPVTLFAGGLVLLALLLALVALAAIGRGFRLRRGFFVLLAVLMSLAALGRIFWPAYAALKDRPSGDPRETVQRFLDALQRQDYAQAYACLDGVETLGLENQPGRDSLREIRAAMNAQFVAELYGECTVDGELAYQQINCRYFDLSKLDSEASNRAMRIISAYVSTHPVGDLYNENGNYRPELMRDAWDQAVLELLQNPESYRSSGGVQLELRWHDGAWRIVPNEKLLQLLTGGMKLTGKGGAA